MRQRTTYVADDGTEFGRKCDACRHDVELHAVKLGHMPEELDAMFARLCKRYSGFGITDWRDCYKLGKDIDRSLQRIIGVYDQMKHGHAVIYDAENLIIVTRPIDLLADDDEIDDRLFTIRGEFTDKAHQCREADDHERVEIWDDIRRPGDIKEGMVFLVRELRDIPVWDKIGQGIPLTEDELEDFAYGHYGDIVYEQYGDNGRWTQHVSTVIADEDGQLWCIDWMKGLTEMQSDAFYEQPFKVRLNKKIVQVVQTEIVRTQEDA